MPTSATQWRVFGQIFLGLTLTGLFFYTMAPFMIALVMGAIIAILCHPIYRRLTKTLPTALAGLLVVFLVTSVILAPLTFVGISVVLRLGDLLRGIKIPAISNLQDLSENPMVLRLIHKIPS